MPLLFCGPMETHSSWTGIHLQCWPWSYAIHSCCRPDVELTSYLLLEKECQCHCFLPPGLPQGFLLLSHDWYVRISSCKPPHEYRGQIHPGRSCGYWWNILLTSMIKFSPRLWEKWASWMEFCTSLTLVRELRGQNCPERGQKVWRLYLTVNFALNPKINVLHAVPGKFFK